MEFWEKIKKDVRKGFQDGLAVIREGAVAVKARAEKLTEEGKRQYKLFELKTKVQKEITELGGKVYGLICAEKDPVADAKVKASVSKIKKLEIQIAKLEIIPDAKPRAKKSIKSKTKSVKPAAGKKAAVTKPTLKKKSGQQGNIKNTRKGGE